MNKRIDSSRTRTGVLLVLLLLARPALGEGEGRSVLGPCDSRPRDASTLVVEANTGEVLHGGTRYPQGTQITVVVTRKNPFKYTYRVDSVVTSLEADTRQAFLSLFPGAALVSSAGSPADETGRKTERSTLKPLSRDCAAEAAWETVRSNAVELESAIIRARERGTQVNAASKAYNAFVVETDRDAVDCKARLDDATALLGALPKLIDLEPLLAGIEEVERASADVRVALAAFDSANATQCASAATTLQAEQVRARHSEIDKESSSIKAMATTVGAAKAEFEAAHKLLAQVLADESAFEEVHRPFVPDSPTNVQVTVFRTNLRQQGSKEQQVVSIPIHVGQSRFAISGGFGFSGIDRRQVVRQAGPVADGEGGVKTGSVFGLEEDSGFRPTVAVLLHGSLWTSTRSRGLGRIGFAATSGVVTTGTGDGRKLDYLLGGSLSLLDEQLFVTLAFHAAEVAELGAGYEVGSPVPADLDDPLPTTKRWAKGLFAGLTFRIR